jgi:putative phosphoesterase
MKIGVLSDTHIPYSIKSLSKKILEILSSADAILHAGDFQDISVLEELSAIAPFYGVCGNMDSDVIRNVLPAKRTINIGGFTIGLIHGWGAPAGLEDRVFSSFLGEKVDVIVHGHSHNPLNRLKNGILMFNPGSPTNNRFSKTNSMGILTLGDKVTGTILTI